MRKKLVSTFLYFLLSASTFEAYAQTAIGVVQVKQGPVQPKAAGITLFPQVKLPQQANIPWSRVEGCTATTFNGRSTHVDHGGNYAIFNVSIPGGAIESFIVCKLARPTTLTVQPATASLTRYGSSLKLRVFSTSTSGHTLELADASEGTTYTSSDPKVATVSADGVVTAVATGSATISVKHGALTGQATIQVQLAKPLGLLVEPGIVSFQKAGENQKLQVYALTQYGRKQAISGATLASDNPAVATVQGDTVTAVGPGKAVITVSAQGLTERILAVVAGQVSLTRIDVNPTTLQFKYKGDTAQLKVTGTYADNSTLDLSASSSGITYASSATGVATVSADGEVQAIADGSATITVRHPSLPNGAKSVAVTVKLVSLSSLAATPNPVALRQIGGSVQLKVTGTYSDNSTQDLTAHSLTTYTSKDATIATVSSDGLVTAVKLGKTSITVTHDGKTLDVPVDVTEPVLKSIAFARSKIDIKQNVIEVRSATTQLKLIGTYDDNSTVDLTAASTGTTYATSNAQIGTVSADGRFFAIPRIVSNFSSVRITATHKGKTAVTNITIAYIRSLLQKELTFAHEIYGVAARGTLAYVAAGANGIHVVDIADPQAPTISKTLPASDARWVTLVGHVLCVADAKDGVILLTMGKRYNETLATLPISGGQAYQARAYRGRLFVAGGKAGVVVYDLANLVKPTRLGATQTGDVRSVAADARWVFALEPTQVLVFDRQTANWWTQAPAKTIALAGARNVINSGSSTPGTFYAATDTGLYRLDATGAKSLVDTSSTGPLVAHDVTRYGPFMFAGGPLNNRNDAAIFTLSNPLNAQYRANYPFFRYNRPARALAVTRWRLLRVMAPLAGSNPRHDMEIGNYLEPEDLDVVPPTVSLLSPADNSTQAEDRDLAIVLDAKDDRFVDKVEFRINNQVVATQNSRPFVLYYPAPEVGSSGGKVTIDAVAYDMNGAKTAANAVTVNLKPISDTTAPSASLNRPFAGQSVEIGKPMTVYANAEDDRKVAEVRLYIDGKRVASRALRPYLFSYTVPATTTDETPLKVQVEALDYGGNTKRSPEITVTAVKLIALSADIAAGDTSFDNKHVAIRGRTVKIDGKHTFKTLWIDQGGSLTSSETTRTKVNTIDLDVDFLFVDEGAKIDVSGLGYRSRDISENMGWSRGNTQTGIINGQGGSHGGPGAPVNGNSVAIYDSMFFPREPGGGGGSPFTFNIPAHGGGVIAVQGKVVLVDGQMLANASFPPNTVNNWYGGAGGTIFVQAGIFAGVGQVEARGSYSWGTTGGGGRVAIHYGTWAEFTREGIVAYGGRKAYNASSGPAGGAGTVFLKKSSEPYGALIVDNRDRPGTILVTRLPFVGKGTLTGVTKTTLTNSAANWYPGELVDHWVIPNTKQTSKKAYKILSHTKDTLTLDVGSDDLTTVAKVGDSYQGVLLLKELVVQGKAQIYTEDIIRLDTPGAADLVLKDAQIAGGAIQMNKTSALTLDNSSLELYEPLELAALTLRNGSTLSVPVATATAYTPMRLKVTGAVSIDATSQIDLNGKGYPGGTPTNGSVGAWHNFSYVNGSTHEAGGSHGGLGGHEAYFNTQGTMPSPTYGRFHDPIEPGGGAGNYRSGRYGRHGGGLLVLEADSLDLAGKILAKSGNRPGATYFGCGAGGGVKITVRLLSGQGTISVDGTCSNPPYGGGGRIAIYYTTLQGFDLDKQLSAFPGPSKSYGPASGAGTIFTKAQSQQYGTLRIDQNNVSYGANSRGTPYSGFRTQLLAIGQGTITAIQPNQLTDSNATFAPNNQLAGLWLNPDTSKNALFRLVANDATNLFTRPVDGDLSAASAIGKTYRGVLRLDTLIVQRGARVITADDINATTIQVDADSALAANNLQRPLCPASCTQNADCQVFGCGTKTTCSNNACQ